MLQKLSDRSLLYNNHIGFIDVHCFNIRQAQETQGHLSTSHLLKLKGVNKNRSKTHEPKMIGHWTLWPQDDAEKLETKCCNKGSKKLKTKTQRF